jgi:uncharacterized protein YvpB
MCVQLYNNIYPFPLSQVMPLSQTAPAIDLCQNANNSNQLDCSAQTMHANQTPAHWATHKHQTKTGITGQDKSVRAAPNWPANRRQLAQLVYSRQDN